MAVAWALDERVPLTEMAHAVASYQAILHSLAGLTERTAREASRLPGWSRAHVVVHLSRNADGNRRMLQSVAAGRVPRPYRGGAAGRVREIEAGVKRPVADLLSDFTHAHEQLFRAWEDLPPELWDHPLATVDGTRPARDTGWTRWRELEVHHVDLDLGFRPGDWPRAFVETALGRTIRSMPRRVRADVPVPDGVWELHTTDGDETWTVVAERSVLEVQSGPAPDGLEVSCGIFGEAAWLLAWLLGRADEQEAGLELTGRPRLARGLRRAFPYD